METKNQLKEILSEFDETNDDMAETRVQVKTDQPDNISTDWLRKSADLLREVELNFEKHKWLKANREEMHDKIKLAKAYILLAEGYQRAGLKW